MSAINPDYRCECGADERCPDPRFDATDEALRAFYAAHPLRRGLGQSVRSRNFDRLLSREARR